MIINTESLEEEGIYFWPTLRTDEVLIVAAEQVSVPGVIEPSPYWVQKVEPPFPRW